MAHVYTLAVVNKKVPSVWLARLPGEPDGPSCILARFVPARRVGVEGHANGRITRGVIHVPDHVECGMHHFECMGLSTRPAPNGTRLVRLSDIDAQVVADADLEIAFLTAKLREMKEKRYDYLMGAAVTAPLAKRKDVLP